MKPRRRHLRLVDSAADSGEAGDETDIQGVEVLLTDTSGFEWSDEADHVEALHGGLKRLAAEVVIDEGVTKGMLHLYLVDPGFMGYLNKTFMGYDGPTDVLAFPIDGPEMVGAGEVDLSLVPTGVDIAAIDVDEPAGVESDAGGVGATTGGPSVDHEYGAWDDDDAVPVHLGDVMVCPQMAARQAPDHTGSFPGELSLLVIHGVLHVLGHDHAQPADSARMRRRERRHLDRLGYRHPADR